MFLFPAFLLDSSFCLTTPEFFAFFFPDAYTAIDWERGFDFLDQEGSSVIVMQIINLK
jgi:hypothetical protein